MNLKLFYKQFSGNDSFETPKDRESVYLNKLEEMYPGMFLDTTGAILLSMGITVQNGFYDSDPAEKYHYYVTTGKTDGAIALFYPCAMERFATKLGGSYYVIPSSRHEVILVPEELATAEELNKAIREVNEEVVALDDRLDDCAYFYNAKTKIFSQAKGA